MTRITPDVIKSFIDELAPLAVKIGGEAGVFPSLILAQGCVESAFGTSELAKKANNLFGIKRGSGWNGPVYAKDSAEYLETWTSEVSDFRVYTSYEGAVRDLVDKYLNGLTWEAHNRYEGVLKATSYEEAIRASFKAGYATDPNYPEKIIRAIETYGLGKYDGNKGDFQMSKKLIVLGHGRSKDGKWDPGAQGNGTTEADWLRGDFLKSLKKYAGNQIDFYEQNMYANREAKTIKGYGEIIELHLDAASASAKGGHIIIYKGYSPDAMDNRLGETIKKHFGLRGGKMFDNRSNLYNLNTFASRKISYRLLELGFITNKANMDHFKANYDQIAKDLVEDILNTSIKDSPATTVKYYRVRKSWQEKETQKGAFVSFAGAKAEADKHVGYHVFDESGKSVHYSSKKAEIPPVVLPNPVEEKPVAKPTVSKSFIEDWAWAVEKGLLDGSNPQNPVSREQLSAVARRLYLLIKKEMG